MYVRVPHYVASFYRNRNEFKPVPTGGVVSIEEDATLWEMLTHFIVPNPTEKLVKEGCFCERMWRKMMRGFSLVENEQGKFQKVLVRDVKDPLTDAEVRDCCQWSAPRYKDLNEYLCIELPPYVYRTGRQVRVDGQWQMSGNGCRIFVAELRRCFWRSCVRYVDGFLEFNKRLGYQRSKLEGIERFMLRYDIRSDRNNKTKESIKRNYNRFIKRYNYQEMDFQEFGDASGNL